MHTQIRILAIKDKMTNQALLQAAFSEYDVKQICSGEDALKIAQQFTPDIILLDTDLPGIDGYQICKALKHNAGTCDIPVIMLSNYHNSEDRLKAYSVGAIDYMSKPFNHAEVLIKVKNYANNRQKQNTHGSDFKQSDAKLDRQAEKTDIKTVSHFLQNNLHCHDMDNMYELFFETMQKLGLSCVLQIRNNHEKLIRSDTDVVNCIEQEILEMSGGMERVLIFGKDRAVFNRKYANLLVRNIGSKTNLITQLMNGLDAGIKAIISKRKLLTKIYDVEDQNQELKNEVSDLFYKMSQSINDNFVLMDRILSQGLSR